jgi:hypothetical protein
MRRLLGCPSSLQIELHCGNVTWTINTDTVTAWPNSYATPITLLIILQMPLSVEVWFSHSRTCLTKIYFRAKIENLQLTSWKTYALTDARTRVPLHIIVKNFSVYTLVLWTTTMTGIIPQISKLINFFERLIKYLIFRTSSYLWNIYLWPC